jgi:RNA polymerase sigma factor (sigma-70 family)
LKAFSNLKQLKSAEVFKSWLFRIAVNRVRDFYRRKTVKSVFGFVSLDDPDFQETEEIAVSPEAPSHMERRAFWKKINQMLRILPRMEKEVFLLRFFDDLSIREISSILGKNESTVKTHLYRALSKIKSTSAGMEELLEGQ